MLMCAKQAAVSYKSPFPLAGCGVYIDPAVRYTHIFRLDCGECHWMAETNDMTVLAARNAERKAQCPICGRWAVDIRTIL